MTALKTAKRLPARLNPPALPTDGLHEYMAICPGSSYGGYWGRGATVAEAVLRCRQSGEFDRKRGRIVIVPKGAKLDDVNGQWVSWPESKHADKACEHCTFQLEVPK